MLQYVVNKTLKTMCVTGRGLAFSQDYSPMGMEQKNKTRGVKVHYQTSW